MLELGEGNFSFSSASTNWETGIIIFFLTERHSIGPTIPERLVGYNSIFVDYSSHFYELLYVQNCSTQNYEHDRWAEKIKD